MSLVLRPAAAFLLATASISFIATPASAAPLLDPVPYLGQADSPFAGVSFSYFHLEDFQDGLLNTPGLSSPYGGIFLGPPGSLADSVEFTPDGGSYYFGSGATGLEFRFDAAILGALPTHAGLVWTDGRGLITFEAFDQDGNSLGIKTGDHADAGQTGETGEDRFYGAINAGGISRIFIKNAAGGIEVDHVQYGREAAVTGAVPEPATWAMMIAGFGLIGGALRRRQAPAVRFA